MINHSLISWRPFTHIKTAPLPLDIVSAKGARLFAKDGLSYIDAIASWWVITHGHCHPHIANAIAKTAKRLDQIVFANFTHAPAQELLEMLRGMLPQDLCAAFFSDNGSTSVEVALKMAVQFWKISGHHHKNKIVAFKGAYHGDTAGCMSVSARGLFTDPYEKLLFDVVRFEDAFSSLTDDTAALIIEPLVQAAGGMIMWDEELLRKILRAARAKNILIIFDEVMTGFFRTGSSFAFQKLDFVPDILCLSKGLTGGYLPLALTVCHQKIYEQFLHSETSNTFFHGHTFTANPLSCAAAVANLQLMDAELTQKIADIECMHRARIEGLKSPFIKNKRLRGTIAAFDVVGHEEYLSTMSQGIARECMKHGVFLRPIGNVVYVMPPFGIKPTELSHVWDVVEMAVDNTRRHW